MAARQQSIAGKASSMTANWTVAVLLGMAFPGSYPSQGNLPNLRPLQPEGWSDAIVVSNRQYTNTDSLALNASDRLYLDFAVINSGGASTMGPFRIELFVDGRLWEIFEVRTPLGPGVYRFREDYAIRRLGIGVHTLRIVADAGGSVLESDETDNEYTRTIIVQGDCFPLTIRVSPREAGTLTANRDPTCGGATVSTSTFGIGGEAPGPPRRLGIAGAPVEEARRDRAFAALRVRVQSEQRVRVIVGLRSDGLSVAPAAAGLRQAEAGMRPIAQAQQDLEIRMSSHNVSFIRRFRFIPYVAMEVDEAALEALATDPEVVSIERDGVVKPLLAESVPLIGAPYAWAQGYDGSGQTIAILDTGADKDHSFLAGKVVSEACYSGGGEASSSLCPGGVTESTGPGSATPCSASDCFHGTAMAGVAAGFGTDFSGVARGARIIAIQVFSQCGGDCVESWASDWIAGLERVLELSAGIDIAAVNMSFGGAVFSEECDAEAPAVKAAMDRLRAADIAPIAASGNAGSTTGIDFPACVSSAISVGSTDDGSDDTTPDKVSGFSNSSPLLDLLAPGRRIQTSVPGGDFASFNGTSLSVPHVAGAWAVMKSKAPRASVTGLLTILKNTGIPVSDSRNYLIKPRIQVDAALDAVIPEHSYSSGTLLTLTAQPNPGFRFKGWRGCESSSDYRCIVEMNTDNHVTAVFQPTDSTKPDLITTSLRAPPTAAVGSDISITSAVRNQGATDAGPFRLGFYLSVDPAITTEDTWFASCTFDSGLAAGESESCSQSFPIPPRVTPRSYFLGAILDDLDRVAESSETNNARAADSGPIEVLIPNLRSRSFVPVILTAAGRNDSFFTSELTLTNPGAREARFDYTYTAHRGGGSGRASDRLAPGQQKIVPDALEYLKTLGIPIPAAGNPLGTLSVEAVASTEVSVLVRTATAVPEGRAGLAYPGIAAAAGFRAPVYLCGLRQNSRDRSNVALQNMGTAAEGAITLRTTVFSGNASDSSPRVLDDVTLEPGGFHQFSPVLGTVANGYVKVERVSGTARFYAYGVINDQGNSDGSFVFPVAESHLEGATGQTLPVIVEVNEFSSELTVTNFSQETKTLDFSFVAEGLTTPDDAARFSLRLEPGRQRIIPDVIHTEMRRKGVQGMPAGRVGLAGALFATVDSGDMSGIVIGARTGSPDGRGGQYGVFYHAVPDGTAFTASAWIDALQQNEENRSNLALVNTGEVDESESIFHLDIYDGDMGRLAGTFKTLPLPAGRWRQINSILANHARGTSQGYVRIRKVSGNNPFLAYGIVNDGGAPGQRSGDGSYLPARE